ncbi:hypothetical protein WG219_19270 [Ectopseudomonas mendocina]|uniref:LysM domain-containing protein n=1 Tax=Ectopseudomonas mendocina TaxID=300 RepID=A0ABZ2RLW1_ECTME
MAHLGSPTSHGGKIITGSGDVGGGFLAAASATAAVINFATMGAIRADGSVDDAKLAALLADPKLTEKAAAANALVSPAPQPAAQSIAAASAPAALNEASEVEPGFYIVQKPMSRSELETMLFEKPDAAVMSKFRALNPTLATHAKPGQLVVLSDPKNYQCTREEALLMEAADKVNTALEPMSDEEASFMLRHLDEISSMLASGSTGMGVGMAVSARYLTSVKDVLEEIEVLHQQAFQRDGHLRSAKFFEDREKVFKKLDSYLISMTKKGIGIPEHPKLKSALGISSRSVVHSWTKAGVAGQIPGYATHIDGIAKASTYIKYGGWIGTAVGGSASIMKVQDVCTAGDKDACERVKYTEGGSFVGSFAGGVAASALLGVSTTGAICVALGAPTAGIGALACGLVVVGTGSLVGGSLGGTVGEDVGEMIYEKRQ